MDYTHHNHHNNHNLDNLDSLDTLVEIPDLPLHLHPSQPQYAANNNTGNIRSRHRPSPKGEQRLWLYQCAVKSCSKGEMKIAGTSRPKGRDVPSCEFCGGKMHWKGTERHPITASAAAAASVNQTIGGSGAGGEVEGGEGDEGLHEYPSLRYHQQDSSRRSPSASRSPDAETLSHNHGYDHGHGHGEAPFLAIRGHLLPSASSSSRGYSVDTARSRPGSSTMEGSSPSSFSAAAAAVDNRSGRPWEL